MANSNPPQPLFGTTTDVNAAFPAIDEIDLTVWQDPDGEYLQHDWQTRGEVYKNDYEKGLPLRELAMPAGGA